MSRINWTFIMGVLSILVISTLAWYGLVLGFVALFNCTPVRDIVTAVTLRY